MPARRGPHFRQIRRLAIDSGRGGKHNSTAPHELFRCLFRTGPLRYILAIAGLIIGAIGVATVLLFLPQGEGGTPAAVAQAPTAEPSANEATDDGEGSLRVCNQTGNQLSIALGYKAPRGWQSEGWWVAAGGECKTVFSGTLDARYYYIFAADDIGGGA